MSKRTPLSRLKLVGIFALLIIGIGLVVHFSVSLNFVSILQQLHGG